MRKIIFFNLLILFSFTGVLHAEGEGIADNFNKEKPKNFSLDKKISVNQFNSFSLRSGMYFKGENVINTESNTEKGYSNFNVVTFQKSLNSFLTPAKKKAVLNKITFNPNELLRNYSGR